MFLLGGDTLYVDDDGGADYTRIQDAIDNASDGDIVYVFNGTYYENVVVDKSINLTGEDKETTIINGSGVGDVVYVSADGVKISGFTIQNSGDVASSPHDHDAGIELRSNNNTILDNIIRSTNGLGVYAYYSNSNTISDNVISNNSDGIRLVSPSSYNVVSENEIKSNKNCGINIRSPNNIISGNTISDNGHGIYFHGRDNIFSGNTVSDNEYGMNFAHSGYSNNISKNHISNNDYGIWSDKPDELPVMRCHNNIYHNNFIDNNKNAYYFYNKQWGGNYWDNWIGVEHPLLRVFPYRIPGAPFITGNGIPLLLLYFNFDWHPAKEPYDIGGAE
jgi:parallel beta-helix repeat protein